jgi:hypothetical protein
MGTTQVVHLSCLPGTTFQLDMGYYAQSGLVVQIIERYPAKNNIQQVVDGDAEYGVADSAVLLFCLHAILTCGSVQEPKLYEFPQFPLPRQLSILNQLLEVPISKTD